MKVDLKNLYKQKIVPSLIDEFGYKNIEQVPKLIKISVNRGVGEATKKFESVRFKCRRINVNCWAKNDNKYGF